MRLFRLRTRSADSTLPAAAAWAGSGLGGCAKRTPRLIRMKLPQTVSASPSTLQRLSKQSLPHPPLINCLNGLCFTLLSAKAARV